MSSGKMGRITCMAATGGIDAVYECACNDFRGVSDLVREWVAQNWRRLKRCAVNSTTRWRNSRDFWGCLRIIRRQPLININTNNKETDNE